MLGRRTRGIIDMVILKTPEEIEKLRISNRIVAEILQELQAKVAIGFTTRELETHCRQLCQRRHVKPAFMGYRGYPAALCASINGVVVHGIPSERKLAAGDILSLDFGVNYCGYYGDAAITVPVGEVSPEAQRLMRITEGSLYAGIEQAQAGNRLGDVSAAIQEHVERAGFSVVRDFVGHGIGRTLHEDPQIPNYGVRGRGIVLKEGMVLAIEPMVNEGGYAVRILQDGWTVVTQDGKLSAHFEHTVAITARGPEILSRIQ